MIKDITIGQFFPGDSVIHRLDPRFKLILTILIASILFVVDNFAGFGVIALVVVYITAVSKIKPSVIFKSIKPLLFVILFTAVFNIFYGNGPAVFPNVSWLSWLTWGGLENAAFMAIRIILLITRWVVCRQFLRLNTWRRRLRTIWITFFPKTRRMLKRRGKPSAA